MSVLPLIAFAAGMLLMMAMIYFAFAGPSKAKAGNRRLESLRERHSQSSAMAAQAQMKRVLAQRMTKLDGVATRFLPNPKQLAKRIEMTGKSWTLSHYVGGSALLAVATLTTPAALLGQLAVGAPVHAWAIGIGSAVITVLVIARLAGLLRQVQHQSRLLAELADTDPLTGFGVRGQVRVGLAHLGEAVGTGHLDGIRLTPLVEQPLALGLPDPELLGNVGLCVGRLR